MKAKSMGYGLTLIIIASMLLSFVSPGIARAAAPQRPAEQPATVVSVEQQVSKEIALEGKTSFFVWMSEKADLSPAAALKTKAEKGQFVFETLKATAERTQKDLRSYLDSQGVQYQAFYIANKILVKGGSQATLDAITSRSDVEKITANHTFQLQKPIKEIGPSAPSGVEPNLTFINVDDVWAMGITGQGTVVAGNDTGLDETVSTVARHYRGCLNPPDCTNWDHNYNWFDATGTYPTNPYDGFGHGTHTTGTMIGDDGAGNQIGVAPGAQTIHCKNMTDGGSGDDGTFTTCFQWDLAPWDLNGANPLPSMAPDSVNNSWGYWGGGASQFEDEIAALQAAGILVEVSAGNEGTGCGTLRSPGDYAEVLTTGSVDHGGTFPGTITGFSSRGPSALYPGEYFPDIMAPGNGIRSQLPGGSFEYWSGTSMAGPHATALIGLLWSASPALRGRVADTINIIHETAAPLTGQQGSNCGGDYTTGPNNDWGFGTIDALAAVQLAIAMGGSGTLEGTVTNADGGAPIEGVTVLAHHEDGYEWQQQTNPAGEYSLGVAVGLYTVTASKYGFLPAQATGVEVLTDTTTTQDFVLTPADMSTVDGTVVDALTGWPLYARIDIAGYPEGPVFTNPETGYYSVSLADGATYNFHVSAVLGGYIAEDRPVGPLAGDQTENFGLNVDVGSCTAPGYEPAISFIEDFEASDGNFTVDPGSVNSTWAWGTPTSGPGNAFSGVNAWATNLSGNYPDNTDDYLLSPDIDTSAMTSGFKLVWKQWLQTESCCDPAYVEVSNDGGASWNIVYQAQGDVNLEWTEQAVNLDGSYAVPNFRVRFHLYSDFSVTYPGWYFDDVAIQGECLPQDGGLVTGYVYDMNSGLPLNDATVTADTGEETTTFATPDDPNLDDGFYEFFVSGQGGTQPPLLDTDFEADNGSFFVDPGSANSTWAWGVPTSGPGFAHSGANVWATNLAGQYPNFSDDILVSPVIDLSAYTGNSFELDWWQWLQTESCCDPAYVQVTNDGGATWNTVYQAQGDVDLSWAEHSVVLDPSYAVSNFQLRFYLHTDLSITYDGWYVDDVSLSLAAIAGGSGTLKVAPDVQVQNPGITTASPARDATAPRAPEAPVNPEDVLWDQPLSAVNFGAYVNQQFSDFIDLSSYLADDFVAAEDWTITNIFVPGDGWNGFTSFSNATALNWEIYADNAGVPAGNPEAGGAVWSLSLAPTDAQVVFSTGYPGGLPSNTMLNLNTPVELPAGNYWLVFYPTMPLSPGGQFGRQAADTANGNLTQFINPGGGFGFGFDWQPWSAIGAPGSDMAFRIEGTLGGGGGFGTLHAITATKNEYSPDTEMVDVPHWSIVRQDFFLGTGNLSFVPPSIEVTLNMGDSTTINGTLSNVGSGSAFFEFLEQDRGFIPLNLALSWKKDLPAASTPPANSNQPSAFPQVKVNPSGVTADEVLIVEDMNAWGVTSIQDILTLNGIPFSIINSGLIESTDFSNYKMVIVPSVQGGAFNTVYNNNITKFEDYIDGGGLLILNAAEQQGDLPYKMIPFGGTNDIAFEDLNYIVTPEHPIFAGVVNPYAGTSASHTFLSDLLPDDRILVTGGGTPGGNVVMIERDHGAGMLVAGGQTFEFGYAYGQGNGPILANMLPYYFFNWIPGGDVPWLSTDPVSGTIDADTSIPVAVTLDAGVPEITQPGDYLANLRIMNDTPYGDIEVPITMTVVPPASYGKLDGTIYSLGYCDAEMIPLEGAVVVVTGNTGDTWTLETDVNGYYQLWLDEANTPVTINVTFPGNEDGNRTGVVIVGGQTTTEDFTLRWLEPCLSVTPLSMEVSQNLGEQTTLQATITNDGAGTATWEFKERDRGYSPTKIHIPASDGKFPRIYQTPSIGRAPVTGAPSASQPIPDAIKQVLGAQAYAIDVYPGYNLVTFDSDDPSNWTVVAGVPGTMFFGGDFLNGDFSKMYVVAYDTNTLYGLNTATGEYTPIGAAVPGGGESWTGLAGAPDGTLYGSATTCGSSTLYNVNPDTGETTAIGTVTNAPCLIDIAANADGELYGVDIVNDNLVQIDPATGAGTIIGSLGADANYAQGLDFEEESGVLYWAAYTGAGELRVIDTTTGASTPVGGFPGGAEVDCLAFATGGGGDIAWLTENPTAGTIPPDGGSTTADVTFDAGVVTQPGNYYGTLTVSSDDPVNSKISIYVTMTVIPPANYGILTGTVTSLGYCDDNPVPLEGATVIVTGGSVFTLTTDVNGEYSVWLAEGTYDVSASADGHTSESATVVVVAQQTVNQDFNLRLNVPCVSVAPDSLEAWLTPGSSETQFLSLINDGAGSAAFKLREKAAMLGLNAGPAGDFPRGTGAPSMERAPYVNAPAAGQVNPDAMKLLGSQAFAVDVYPGANLVTFDSDDPTNWTVIGSVAGTSFFAGDFLGGDFSKLYVVGYDTNTMYALDTATAAYTAIGQAIPGGGETWSGLAGAPDGTLYGAATTCGSSSLYTINPDTGEATFVGPVTNAGCLIDIAVNADGSMYGVDIINDVLLSIDPSTGAGTVIGSIGYDANYAQGMDCNEETGLCYMAAFNYATFMGEFRVFDLETGNSTLIGTFPGGAEVDSLGFATGGGSSDIPWLSENPLEGVVDPDSTFNVEVTFTALPTMTAGTYTGTLVVNTGDPNNAKVEVPVTLNIADCIPVVSVELSQLTPQPIYPNNVVEFSANILPGTASTPFDYIIDFGDGTEPVTGTATEASVLFNHAFASVGNYHVTFTVTNSCTPNPVVGYVDVVVTELLEPEIEVEPLAFTATVPFNGGFTQVISIENLGNADLSFVITDTASWLSVAPITGTLAGGEQVAVVATLDATGLAAGEYTATIIINSNDADENPVVVAVTLIVLPEIVPTPDITVTPSAITETLGMNETGAANLFVGNVGDADLTVFGLTETADWLTVSPTQSFTVMPGEIVTVTLGFDTTGLAAGTYTTTLTITSDDPDEGTVTVLVTLVVTAPPPPTVYKAFLPVILKATAP